MITENIEKIYKNTIIFIKKLKGYDKRQAIASFINDTQISLYCAVKVFSVSFNYLKKCILELKYGHEIKCKIETRGRKSVEKKYPGLKDDIVKLIDNYAQTDPRFKTEKMYMRLTVKEIINMLVETGKYTEKTLPKKSAMAKYLNKLGYKLKKVKKSKPLKKIKETDDIFDNINKVKAKYINDTETVMMSIDCKDRVKLGEYSRGGYSRTETKALDHDFESEYITPFGILDLKKNKPILYNTKGKVTADYMVDMIIDYWKKSGYEKNKKRLVIFLDNGPENASRRTRFIYRLAIFADIYNIEIEMAYYPPYHSKYNPIERIWARLENFWNGSIIDNETTCLNYMKNMTWKGVNTEVYLNETEYTTGIKETKETMTFIENFISRKPGIEKWAFTISAH